VIAVGRLFGGGLIRLSNRSKLNGSGFGSIGREGADGL